MSIVDRDGLCFVMKTAAEEPRVKVHRVTEGEKLFFFREHGF